MKIIIKLDNPKFCDGCPLLEGNMYNCSCRLNNSLMDSFNYDLSYEYQPKHHGKWGKYTRPKDCIKDNGK